MSAPQRTSSQGHTRNKSSTKSRPRSSTKGPLDVEDTPLSSPQSPAQLSPRNLPRRTDSRASTSSRRRDRSSGVHVSAHSHKDFSFLTKPEIYHPLTPLNVPLAFRNSSKQPDPEAPLEELVAKGHFRAAAIAAVQELTGTGPRGAPAVDPADYDKIFGLLYTRLACLTLIDATALAAQEAKALEDMSNARLYVDETSGEHLAPWELRVLNVRLQALGFNDSRRAVMAYHDLAREARVRISRAASSHDNTISELWKARLHELGIRVAGALIEMDDVAGATCHLANLRDTGDGSLALSKALLWIHLGDVGRAREQCVAKPEGDGVDGVPERVISALCDMADASYDSALETWKQLRQKTDDEMVGINAAVCLLYLGKIQEGRYILEELVDSGSSSHTLLFNLSTMYELCTERNRGLKMRLADQVSRMDESPRGWERTTADFKL